MEHVTISDLIMCSYWRYADAISTKGSDTHLAETLIAWELSRIKGGIAINLLKKIRTRSLWENNFLWVFHSWEWKKEFLKYNWPNKFFLGLMTLSIKLIQSKQSIFVPDVSHHMYGAFSRASKLIDSLNLTKYLDQS